MALDRQSIEKRDFPMGDRGYDPEAVDAHLTAVADEVAEFKRSARQRSDMLAASASEQVRAIVEAAEGSAANIQRAAEGEAREIREEADNDARATRQQAVEQAREYVTRVSESANTVLGRLESMEQELRQLIDGLHGGSDRLDTNLRQLEQDLAGVGEVVRPRRFKPDPAPEPEAPAAAEPAAPSPAPQPAVGANGFGMSTPAPAPEAAELSQVIGAPEPGHEPVGSEQRHQPQEGEPGREPQGSEQHAAPESGANQDAEGARLIALNMALNGTPREETARYLTENFQLSDAGGLLDEVYASIEG